ncbi:MAG: Ig-like domain-containing protein, partial [Bacillota bacterium]|nr:Ig-like domain-containing protein [Bacillota bacterium]
GTNGTVTNNGNSVTYIPNSDFNGEDTFTYTLNGGSYATVTVNVNSTNNVPTISNQSITTEEDSSVDFTIDPNDIDGDELTITVSGPSNGTLSDNGGNNYTYTPDDNYNGEDEITFELDDGIGGLATGIISITVTPVGDDPVAIDDSADMDEDTVKVIDVLSNDENVDNLELLITNITQGTNGTVTNNGDSATYTPNSDFNGTDTFTYTLNGISTAIVTVNVKPVNDNSSGGGGGSTTSEKSIDAKSDNLTTFENTEVSVEIDVLMANDKDAKEFESVQKPNNGSVSLSGTTVTFMPDEGFVGRAYFYYTISNGDEEDNGVVIVTVEEAIFIPEDTIPEGNSNPDELLVINPDIVPLGAIDYSGPYILGYPDITFRPERQITRAEMAAIFTRILMIDKNVFGEAIYSDNDVENWYYDYVDAVSKYGIMEGYQDGLFKPDSPITHAEMASAFSKYWELKGIEISEEGGAYNDIEGHWAEKEINRFFNSGISVGFIDGSFRPNAFTTRSEMVVMVNRALTREGLYDFEPSFTDVDETFWGYGAIEAATRLFK